MGDNNKEHIEEILEGAAGVDRSHRLEFVKEACNGDSALFDEVWSLLNAGDHGSLREFLDKGLPQIKNSVAMQDAVPQTDSEVQSLRREEAEERDRWIGEFIGEPFKGKGKYEITKLRRFGLMASLFFAKDRKVDRTVVIKIPRMSAYVKHDDDDATTRDAKTNIRNNFRTEFNALKKLEHCSYVVRVIDFDDLPDGRPFMVLEYIDGLNGLELLQANFLGGKATRTGLAFNDVANLIRQTGKGLEAAHNLEILHRDLKAENIMVSGDGHVRLIDFNAADVKLPISPMSTVFQHQTWGTLGYTSPEQLKNMLGTNEDREPIELMPASDIYSLAVTAYQLLTGKLPFSINLADLIKEQVACSFTPASKVRPGLDERVDKLLRSALDYDPGKRPQGAKKFTEDLALALERLGTATTNIPPHPRPSPTPLSKYAIAAMVILVLAAGGFGLWKMMNRSAPIPDAKEAIVSSTGQSLPAFSSPSPASTTKLQRTFSYWLDLTRAVNGKCVGTQLRASGQEPFTNGDCFVLNFTSKDAGYLYLINEGRNYRDATSFYYEGKYQIRPNQPMHSSQLVFDIKDGIEKFWFLFSDKQVQVFESFKAPREIPEEKTTEIRAFLTQNTPADLFSEEDRTNATTEVRASGDPVAFRQEFRNRKVQ